MRSTFNHLQADPTRLAAREKASCVFAAGMWKEAVLVHALDLEISAVVSSDDHCERLHRAITKGQFDDRMGYDDIFTA